MWYASVVLKTIGTCNKRLGIVLSPLRKELTNNEGNICEAVTHRTEAEEVTVGNQPMLELYGIVECKLLGF